MLQPYHRSTAGIRSAMEEEGANLTSTPVLLDIAAPTIKSDHPLPSFPPPSNTKTLPRRRSPENSASYARQTRQSAIPQRDWLHKAGSR